MSKLFYVRVNVLKCSKCNTSLVCTRLSQYCSDLNILIYWWTLLTLNVFAFLVNDGVPKSPHREEIKANICGIMDREMNSLTRKLVVWVPLNVTSMHVPDRWSGTRLMGMFNTWARCQFRQACPWKESPPACKVCECNICTCVTAENTPGLVCEIKMNYNWIRPSFSKSVSVDVILHIWTAASTLSPPL